MEYIFKSHEWEQLARCWGIDEDVEDVKQFISVNFGADGFTDKQIRSDTEQFLHALINEEKNLAIIIMFMKHF